MMCRELDWTTQLGEAFTADQAGVLDAIQRLRKQAEYVGNLQTSPQMTVDNQTEDGKEVIVLKPASNGEVVYVPSYDPVAVYAPPAETTVAPARDHDDDHDRVEWPQHGGADHDGPTVVRRRHAGQRTLRRR